MVETLRRRSVPHATDATPDTRDSTINNDSHALFSRERMTANPKLKRISRRAKTSEHTMQYTDGGLLDCAFETCIVLLTDVTLKKLLNMNKRM